jgi:hypothetical protein
VNAQAQQTAGTPFQQYSTDPSAFVAPINPTQQAGIEQTMGAANMAQPYYNAATGFAMAGSQAVNPSALNTPAYMNPYLNTVLGSTAALINQSNAQAMSGQTGNAMQQGYFGGDRSGIASAVLQGQQNLAAGQTYSGIASDAYNQAMAAAQQQQGVGLSAEQANRAALQQTGETLAGFGGAAQGAALSGAQAELGAGTTAQQTQQAGDTALYNQFLQQQSYPFQVAQFLANIAEGTGALSGSTTTTQQPQSIFSDERLKEDMVPVGVGFDGANIYRFRYRGDPTTRIGFSAQEMARLHPEAVHTTPSGFLAVDYGRATDAAAGFARAANDNYGDEPERRRMAAGGRAGFQGGGGMPLSMQPGISGAANPYDMAMILQAQQQGYAPFSQAGLYGGQSSGGPYGGVQGHVPAANLPVGHLQVASPPPAQQSSLSSDLKSVASLADDAEGLKSDYHLAHEGYDKLRGFVGGGGDGDGQMTGPPNARGGRIGRAPGGLTAADYAAQARQQAAISRIRALGAQAHAHIAARNAAAQRNGGIDWSGINQGLDRFAGNMSGGLSNWAGHPMNAPDPRAAAGNAAVGSVWHGLDHYLGNVADTLSGGANSWVDHPMWGPGQQGAEAGLGVGRAAAAQIGAARAAAIHHHTQQAQAHAAVAQQLAAPTASAPGAASPSLASATGLPSNRAPVTPIDIGDVSNLQPGFAPANMHAYNPNIFQRFGNWVGDELHGAGQALAQPGQTRAMVQDARNLDTAPGAMSEAFHPQANAQVGPVMQSEAFQDSRPAVAAPSDLVQAAPISSEAFQPREHPPDLAAAMDANPQLAAARGGFARAARQAGGDISSPMNDDPYKPQGAGLNIPTSETQHPQLAVAKPPGQQDSGLSSALGDAASIAKIAALFAARGGRIGRDGGGPVTEPAADDDTASVTPKTPLHDAAQTPAAAAADDATTPEAPPPKQPGFGEAGQPPEGHQGFLPSLFHGVEKLGQGLAGAAGYEGGGKWNRDQLMPLLSAIGAAGSVPTVHPFVALAAGLGGYGKAYMQQQQAEAGLNLTQAQATREQQQAIPESIRQYTGIADGPAMTRDGRFVDKSRTFTTGDGKVHHYITADEMLGMGGQGGAGGQTGTAGATMQTQQGGVGGAGAPAQPVSADYSGGGHPRYTLGPSQQEIARAEERYGVDPNASGISNRVHRQMGNVQVTDDEIAAAGKVADQYDGTLNDASSTQRALLDNVAQIQKLPESGPGAVGPGQEERQLALSSYNMMLRMFGLQGDPSIDDNTATTQILQKLSALQGAAKANQFGQHAASIANQLQGVMPSGHMQKPAAYNLLSQMLVANQQDRDFANYRGQYQRLGVGDFQSLEAFHRDFDPIYARENKQLQSMMARGSKGGPSIFEVLQNRPQDIQRFEQGWTDAGGTHHQGFGYLGRYLQ